MDGARFAALDEAKRDLMKVIKADPEAYIRSKNSKLLDAPRIQWTYKITPHAHASTFVPSYGSSSSTSGAT